MDFSKLPTNFFATAMQFTKNIHDDQYPSIDPTRKQLSLAGKIVVITGASRGLGAKAFAPAFAKAGVRGLVLLATNVDGLTNTSEQIQILNPSVQTLCIATDISDVISVESAFEQILQVFGRNADILINNAGTNGDGEGRRIFDADVDTWWRQFEINAKGTFLVTRTFVNQLQSAETPATVINLTTGAAWKGSPLLAGYGMSKLVALQQVNAIAACYPNITAVALHPGLLETDMLPRAMRRFDKDTPELVGGFAVWLCHPHARFLSGRVVCAEWDVDDLLARKDEIKAGADLTIDLVGKLGAWNFS